MCLDSASTKKYKSPKDWIEGYKFLTYRMGEWRSLYASQSWEFGEMVEAQFPIRIYFKGTSSPRYRKGIHAYKGTFHLDEHSDYRIVKVLLFGVTHEDHESYRADRAIVIEVLDRTGNRIPW